MAKFYVLQQVGNSIFVYWSLMQTVKPSVLQIFIFSFTSYRQYTAGKKNIPLGPSVILPKHTAHETVHKMKLVWRCRAATIIPFRPTLAQINKGGLFQIRSLYSVHGVKWARNMWFRSNNDCAQEQNTLISRLFYSMKNKAPL